MVEFGGAGDAVVEIEDAAGLGGGEGDEVAPCFVPYEGWRRVCSWRGEALSTGVRSPFLAGAAWSFLPAGGGEPGREVRAATARNAWASMDRVACRYQARYLRT